MMSPRTREWTTPGASRRRRMSGYRRLLLLPVLLLLLPDCGNSEKYHSPPPTTTTAPIVLRTSAPALVDCSGLPIDTGRTYQYDYQLKCMRQVKSSR